MSSKKMVIGILVIVAGFFVLSASTAFTQVNWCEADLNHDGEVSGLDTLLFKNDYPRSPSVGEPCPPDGPAPVPKTGQTTSYATGDDGELGRGLEWPNPRFTDNGNGTVTDNLTGLIWIKDAGCIGYRTWLAALSACSTLADGQCGLTDGSQPGDWRLPNLRELQSLVDYNYHHPTLSNTAGTGRSGADDPFIRVESHLHWTSTTDAFDTNLVWLVCFAYGFVDSDVKASTFHVWPVRGGR